MIQQQLKEQLAEIKSKGLYRSRYIQDDIADFINFSSNDYLSLRDDARIKTAFQQGFANYPAGSGASMAVMGYHSIHHELEQEFCRQLKVDAALLFNSGYAANLGVINFLAKLNCRLLIDKAAHASIYDGLKLSSANYTRYLPNNLIDLQKKLTINRQHNCLVITEAIFSMSGQQVNLAALNQLIQPYHAKCIIDEAHAFGVIGCQGLGAVNHYNLTQEDVPLRIITFGKAFGFQGAIVAGQRAWIEGLFQAARSQIYTTAMSPALAYGLLQSLAVVIEADSKRQQLLAVIDYFQQAIKQSALTWRQSSTAIQQLLLGCPYRALNYSAYLKQYGIICLPMRTPTVNVKDTGLRIVLNAHHEPHEIDKLITLIHECYETEHS